jgi:enterobactin synthetase component D
MHKTMTFSPTFGNLHACMFVERTFQVDARTLQQLERLYPLPDALAKAVLKRQVEFLAGRVCAQQALTGLTGHQPGSIPSQPDRSPAWPSGIVGSLTHTTGYAAALIASETHYQGIGIDCEIVLSPDNLKLQKYLCVTHELEALHEAHSNWHPERLLTLVFSAKESLFKCLYRQVQKFFGFSAARLLSLDQEQGTFVIQLEQDLTPDLSRQTQWRGHFKFQGNLLMTVILYPGTPHILCTENV